MPPLPPHYLAAPPELYGQRVCVFRNPSHRCLSVLHNGRIIAHVQDIALQDIEFRVRPAGRQRMLLQGIKTIHAYAVGTVVAPRRDRFPLTDSERLTYDPRLHRSYVLVGTEQPIHRAKHCRIVGNEIWLLQR